VVNSWPWGIADIDDQLVKGHPVGEPSLLEHPCPNRDSNPGPWLGKQTRYPLAHRAACSKYGDAEHYIFECPLTVYYHFSKPSASNESLWFSNIKYNSNVYKICRLIKWLLANESFLQSI